MAKSGMNPKTLQYLMGHSDIGVMMNTYTHLGLDAAKDEMIRMEELERAKKAVQGEERVRIVPQKAFKVNATSSRSVISYSILSSYYDKISSCGHITAS